MKAKIVIFRDHELDISGVTPVWTWICPSETCKHQTSQMGSALYWENTVRGANHHLAWHAAKEHIG